LKTKEEDIRDISIMFCFILAMMTLMPILIQFMPEGKFPPGSQIHTIFKSIYWCCGAMTFLFMLKKNLLKDGIIGAILICLMGPVVILTMSYYYIYLKISNGIKRREN
jgi:hypothetical protein